MELLLMMNLMVRTLVNGFVALVDDKGRAVKLLRPTDELVGTCHWLVERWGHAGECEIDEEYGECGACSSFYEGPSIVDCGATTVYGDDGWRCENGHSHFSRVEYYDDDEIAAAGRGHFALAANAAAMDGTPLA